MKKLKQLLFASLLFLVGNYAQTVQADTGISVSTSSPSQGILDMDVTNVPSNISSLQIPFWSEKDGQDDIQWYDATKIGEGHFSLQVKLKNHNFETGAYRIHLYGINDANQQQGLFSTTTQVTEDMISSQRPNFAITDVNLSNGTYRFTAQETDFSKKIQTVRLATWSGDQSNISWYEASPSGAGNFSITVDFRNHKKTKGIYTNHVYVTYTDGSQAGYVTDTVDLSNVNLPIQVSTQFVQNSTYRFTAENISTSGTVSYAVWSDENGQDDIQWYTASRDSSGNYSGDIPLRNHKGSGLYHLHLYQEGRGLRASSFQVKASELPARVPDYTKEINTYPVGQCTWGAKELAPWAGNYWGNGAQWAASARKVGFRTGSTPQVGAIICWNDGGYGHVAVVVAVDSATRIQVKEANYAGKQYIGNHRGWFNPAAAGQGSFSYIYPN